MGAIYQFRAGRHTTEAPRGRAATNTALVVESYKSYLKRLEIWLSAELVFRVSNSRNQIQERDIVTDHHQVDIARRP